MENQLYFDLSSVISMGIALLALIGVLIGVIWSNLQANIKKLEEKIDKQNKKIDETKNDIHIVETGQLTMMQTIVRDYMSKDDCNRITDKK